MKIQPATAKLRAGTNAVPGWMLSKLGVRNIVSSQEEWPTVGWETIAKANPTFIVAAEMNRRRFPADDIAVKREYLTGDPVTSEMEPEYLMIQPGIRSNSLPPIPATTPPPSPE